MLKGKVHKYGADEYTDVIIPARYLSLSEPDELAKHCLEDMDTEFVVISAGGLLNILKRDGRVGGFRCNLT